MLRWLFRCPLPEGEDARKWHIVNGIVLTFLAIVVLDLAINGLLNSHASDLNLLLAGVIMLGLYVANHRGAVMVTASGLVVVTEALIVAFGVNSHLDLITQVLTPIMGVIPIALTGALLSWRAVPITVLVVSAATVWLYAVGMKDLVAYAATAHVSSTVLVVPVILFSAVGALSALSGNQVERALKRLEHRNGDLERANRDLAAQRERDLRLQANLGNLATELSAVSSRQGVAVTTQASSISQVVSAVAELDSTASQIADRASEVRQAADQALSSVQQGQGLLLRSREAVERNRAEVQLVIQRMRDLDQLTVQVTRF